MDNGIQSAVTKLVFEVDCPVPEVLLEHRSSVDLPGAVRASDHDCLEYVERGAGNIIVRREFLNVTRMEAGVHARHGRAGTVSIAAIVQIAFVKVAVGVGFYPDGIVLRDIAAVGVLRPAVATEIYGLARLGSRKNGSATVCAAQHRILSVGITRFIYQNDVRRLVFPIVPVADALGGENATDQIGHAVLIFSGFDS